MSLEYTFLKIIVEVLHFNPTHNPTKNFSGNTLMVPFLHQFSTVVLMKIDAVWLKFALYFVQI